MTKRCEGWRGVAAFIGLIVLLYIAMAITIFGQLVFRYGIWPAITRPIYPVQMKPAIVLSNGEVLSPNESYAFFLIWVMLWLALALLNLRWVSRWLKNR